MDRERGPGDSGGGGKTKKKEKGYKTVGLDTSEDDDDAAMIMGSQRLVVNHFLSDCFT